MNRKSALKSITGLAMAALAPFAAARPAGAAGAPHKAQNVVVHLSDSEGEHALHAAFMGIGLATALRQTGADVTLMLDVSAPNLAKTAWRDKGLPAPASAMPSAPSMPPMRLGDALAGFVRAGGSIRLCPHCSRMCGVMPGDTVPGAQMAGEGELARIVFNADKVVDY